MSELSPAAQAVWESFNEDEAGCFVDYGEKLAAALRAVADQVVPEHKPWNRTGGEPAARHKVRLEILAITAELRGHDD